MGQQTLWANNEYKINSALIKRYLIEILAVDLPVEMILDELKSKESNPHHLALIESIDSHKLARTLLTSEYGLQFLEVVSLNPSSPIILALNKLDNETIKKLFDANSPLFKTKILSALLKNHSAQLCEELLEKLSDQGINHIETNVKEMLKQCFKQAIQPRSFMTLKLIKASLKELLDFIGEHPIKFGLFNLIGLSFIVVVVLSSPRSTDHINYRYIMCSFISNLSYYRSYFWICHFSDSCGYVRLVGSRLYSRFGLYTDKRLV